ncbi:MAG: hypothetical protein ACK53Y_25985, partial [bacterium]
DTLSTQPFNPILSFTASHVKNSLMDMTSLTASICSTRPTTSTPPSRNFTNVLEQITIFIGGGQNTDAIGD